MNVQIHDRLEAPISQSNFFKGWGFQPREGALNAMAANSDFVITAVDHDTGQTIGMITAITDGVIAAYIPFLEVAPAYQKLGIGSQLVKKMLTKLSAYYMIDLICDDHLTDFYAPNGFIPSHGMSIRNYLGQATSFPQATQNPNLA